MTDPTERLRRYGEDIASAVSPARSRVAAMRAIGQANMTPPRRAPRIAFATLGVLVVLNVVTAGVADAAVPGDVLYPLDRGYEAAVDLIGFSGDHRDERLAEAMTLVERSELDAALDLVAETIDDESVREAVATLQSVGNADPDLPNHVQALVSGVHDWVTARHEGEDVEEATARVRLLALQIGEMAREAEQTGPPEHAEPAGPPAEPGPPAPKEEKNPPRPADQQGRPDHAGNDGQGTADPPPDDPGPPAEPPGRSNRGQGNQPPVSTTGGDTSRGRGGPPDEPGKADPARGGGRPDR